MYVVFVVFLVLFLSLPVFVVAQEPTEPTDVGLTVVPEEDFRMKWRSDTDFSNFTPDAQGFVDGVANTDHKFIFGLGDITFEAEAPNSTPTNPKKISFTVGQATISTHLVDASRWWDFFRVQWRCRATVTVDGPNGPETYTSNPAEFSEQSWWVLVVGMFTVAIPIST